MENTVSVATGACPACGRTDDGITVGGAEASPVVRTWQGIAAFVALNERQARRLHALGELVPIYQPIENGSVYAFRDDLLNWLRRRVADA